MKVKTSITFPADLLARLDRIDTNRSAVLERAANAYLDHLERVERDRKDVEIINRHASRPEPGGAGHARIPEVPVKRGELYLVRKPGSRDPRKQRVFVVASRQALIDSAFFFVICAPVYSQHDGLSTQVPVGVAEGLKKESSIHCDDLVSLPKSALTNYVGSLKVSALAKLDRALMIALGLDGSGQYSKPT